MSLVRQSPIPILARKVSMGWGFSAEWPGSWMVQSRGSKPLILPLALGPLKGGICPAPTTGRDGCKTLSHPRSLGPLLSTAGSLVGLVTASSLGILADIIPMLWGISSLKKQQMSPLEGTLLWIPPHQRRRGNTLTPPSLSANRCGFPPADISTFSTQCWRAWAYATVFSHGISQISLQAQMELAGSMNFFWRIHGSAGGAWWQFSLGFSSLILLESQNEAHTSLASLLWSSTSGTATNSPHQLAILHVSTFHGNYLLNSMTGG